MPVQFVLKRYLPEFPEFGDLYEAIKTGKKTSEYRDATPYWAKRLLNKRGLSHYNSIIGCRIWMFTQEDLKHTEATFRVGYTKGPTLHATIKDIIWKPREEQFEIHIENVVEYT